MHTSSDASELGTRRTERHVPGVWWGPRQKKSMKVDGLPWWLRTTPLAVLTHINTSSPHPLTQHRSGAGQKQWNRWQQPEDSALRRAEQ